MNQNKQSSDLDFEITFYEGLIRRKADFLQALIMLGDLYTKKGLYEKGLDIDKKLVRLRPEDPFILYNLACSYALVNEIDKAFAVMKLAVACGYEDFGHLEHDPDLVNLRRDGRFADYLSQIKNTKP